MKIDDPLAWIDEVEKIKQRLSLGSVVRRQDMNGAVFFSH